MSLRVVTGGAGTGKTTRLLALANEWLDRIPLRDGQQVLALTFMHGSKRRLAERLGRSKARGRFECVTFDGFARELCNRWRSRVAASGTVIPEDDSPLVHDAICAGAAMLLAAPDVAKWVAATHPLIVVDEFQDCGGARPKIVEQLGAVADVLVAADPFQDLSALEPNPALELLGQMADQTETLSHVHRTDVPALLAAATALRTGKPVVAGPGLTLKTVPGAPLGAWEVSLAIAECGSDSPVVIAAGKKFATPVIKRVEAKPIGKKGQLGPYRIPWEGTPETLRSELQEVLAIDDGARSSDAIRGVLPAGNPLSRWIMEWLARERRLRGRTEFTPGEIRTQLARAEAAHRATPRRDGGRRALTVHQAKNREFRNVIVLWGFDVPPRQEIQRRWLYNAITRATHSVRIIVLGPDGRLKQPPFA